VIGTLQAAWLELESESRQSTGFTARRVLPESAIDLFVGLEGPGAVRLFLVEVPRNSIAGISRWPACAGFTVRPERVPNDRSRDRVVVRLSDPGCRDIFAALAADTIAAAATQVDGRGAIGAIVGRLERWQRFLESHGSDGLSIQAQHGLFGELWFLERFLLSTCGPAAAVQAWTGPLAKDQDFQLPGLSCEVKASAMNPDQKVRVSNVRQLDDSAPGELFLMHVALEERNTQGRTLVDLVTTLRSALGEQTSLFNERLVNSGYLDVHSAGYAQRGYVVKHHQSYRVSGDFPRILERELRPGVGGVTYALTLSACVPFAVADAELIALLPGAP